MNYWLVKSDPETYGWPEFQKEKKTSWDGIRNYAARLHLRAMKKEDRVLFYHSGGESSIIGIAFVTREHYPDPTAKEGDWASVGLECVRAFGKPVSLQSIKSEKTLKNMLLLKISRLSVMPVTKDEFEKISEMGA